MEICGLRCAGEHCCKQDWAATALVFRDYGCGRGREMGCRGVAPLPAFHEGCVLGRPVFEIDQPKRILQHGLTFGMLWTSQKQFADEPFEAEAELEAAVAQFAPALFGPSRVYLDVKRLIGAK